MGGTASRPPVARRGGTPIDLVRIRLDAEHIRYSVLTGATKDRKSAIEGFQNGASEVFLISLKAGGVGLNLTAADTVIIFDPWWNPAVAAGD